MVEHQQNSLLSKIAAYTEILAADPRSTIFVSLSESYRKVGLLDDAYSVAKKGLGVLPDYGPGHVVLARILCQQGDLLGSEKSFKKALQLDGDNLAALVGFSRLYLMNEQTTEARSLLLHARELAPADSVINKLLLSIPVTEKLEELPSSVALQEDEPAREDEPAAEKSSSSEPFESVTLAELYLQQGFEEKALAVYKVLLARNPDNLELRRRIRGIESSDSSPLENTAESAVVAPAPEPLEDVFNQENRDSQADTTLTVDVGHCAENPSVLDQLNLLLNSIQKRRGDV